MVDLHLASIMQDLVEAEEVGVYPLVEALVLVAVCAWQNMLVNC